jgi:hypothetical protein
MTLTDQDQVQILNLARPLSPQQREIFFERVAAELGVLPVLGPGLVARVCAKIQRELIDPPLIDGVED